MQKVPHARVKGPLAPFADGFRAELDRLGYTLFSREFKINEIAGLMLTRFLGHLITRETV